MLLASVRQMHRDRLPPRGPMSETSLNMIALATIRSESSSLTAARSPAENDLQKLELSAKLSIEIPHLQGLLADDEHFDSASLSQ